MIYGFSSFGYEGTLVNLEVDFRNDVPAFEIFGLEESSIEETKARIKLAVSNSGLEFPDKKVLIALSPTDIKKHGSSFDLPIALSILGNDEPKDILVMGELDSSGNVLPVPATFAACQTALGRGIKYAILPEGSPVPNGIHACFARNLKEALIFFNRREALYTKEANLELSSEIRFTDEGFEDIEPLDEINNDFSNDLKFAMAVAVAGKHNLFVCGVPGNGKTKILQYVPQLLPELSAEETQETTRIYSLTGLQKPNQNYMTRRPFRMPYPTMSIETECGGGINCQPGEVSLAHNGVLFIDEASEFRSSVLQTLRVPITKHSIILLNSRRSIVYPADFQLVMTTSPCPCGNYGVKGKICLCSKLSVNTHWRKISGPLLDRMEIRFNCHSGIQFTDQKMTLETMRQLIATAWKAQQKRNFFNGRANGDFIGDFENAKDTDEIAHLGDTRKAIQIINLARTIADMYGREKISHSDYLTAKKLRADKLLDEE